jgi:hypothetical protein
VRDAITARTLSADQTAKKGGRPPLQPAAPLSFDLRDQALLQRRTPSVDDCHRFGWSSLSRTRLDLPFLVPERFRAELAPSAAGLVFLLEPGSALSAQIVTAGGES